MNKIQKIKFGMKVLKGRCVKARGATPGMGINEVIWGVTPGMGINTPGIGSNNISIAQRSTDKKSNELNNYFVRLVTL